MDTIRLVKEIEKKIEKAKCYLPTLLAMFQQQEGINLTYRIKDKNRILEKVMLFSNNPKFQDMDEIEILNRIRDIIGLTVVIDKLEEAFAISNEIINQLESQAQTIEFNTYINHISDKGGPTGYKGLLLLFDNQEGIPFEIQVTDNENLAIREATHEEFEKIKYAKVRTLLYEQKEIDDISK